MWDGNWKVAIPLCGPLFVRRPLVGWNRALQKNKFSGSEKLYFSHMLALLPVHSKSILGNLKHCFTPISWWKQTFWGLSGASAALGFHLADPSRLKADTLTTESQGPCVRRILPSYSLSGLAARGWGPGLWLQKNHFWRPLFFWQCPCETQKWDVATLLSLSPGQPIRQSPALPN